MKLRFVPYRLELRNPFRLAHGSRTGTDTVMVQLSANGMVGFGEASLPPYLGESTASVSAFLSRIDAAQLQLGNPTSTRHYIDGLSPSDNAAKAAIEMAFVDLLAKTNGVPSRALFGMEAHATPPSAFTIGISTIDELPEKLKQAEAFSIIKLKLGGEIDVELFNAVRNLTDRPLMVDANQGWATAEQTLRMIDLFALANVLLVEQPLPTATAPETWHWLKERSSLPIFADESVKRLADLPLAKELFHGINIKLMKCTGMYEAFDMMQFAKANGLKVMMGCMTESGCATMAAAQLAPLADLADLDGPWLITNNPYLTPTLHQGRIVLSTDAGHGAVPATTGHPFDAF